MGFRDYVNSLYPDLNKGFPFYFFIRKSYLPTIEPDATEILSKAYPRDLVERAYSGEVVDLPSPMEFRDLHSGVYSSFKRRNPNTKGSAFRHAVNELYPEFRTSPDVPNLYEILTGKIDLDDEEYPYVDKIKDRCKRIMDEGQSVVPRVLEAGNDVQRRLFNDIRSARRRYNSQNDAIYTDYQFLEKVVGMPHYLFTRLTYRKSFADLGEFLITALMKWTSIIDPTGAFFQNGFHNHFSHVNDVSTSGTSKVLYATWYDDNGLRIPVSVRPDLRVRTADAEIAGEVKTGSLLFSSYHLRMYLLNTYAPESGRTLVWTCLKPEDNFEDIANPEIVDGKVVFMLRKPSTYPNFTRSMLLDNGIDFIDLDTVSDYITKLVDRLEQEPYYTLLQSGEPVLHDPKKFLSIFDLLINKPHLMQHPSNRHKLAMSHDLLTRLIECADEVTELSKEQAL